MSTRDITLRWDDPNMIEKGHKVYRSKTPMDINNMPAPIATLDKNTTEYVDVDQTIGDTNYYRVSAYINGHEMISNETALIVSKLAYIYIGTYGNTVDTMRKLNPDGSVLWEVPTESGVIDVVVSEEYVWATTVKHLLIKYDLNGNEIFSISDNRNESVQYMGEFVYTLNNEHVRKYDTDGNILLSIPFNGYYGRPRERAYRFSIDVYGNIYVSILDDSTLRKYDENGKMLWSIALDKYLTEITIYNHIYVGDAEGRIYKIDIDGNIIWSKRPDSNRVYGIATDTKEHVYHVTSGNVIYEHDLNGDLVWSYNSNTGDSDIRYRDIAVDSDNFIYASGIDFRVDDDAENYNFLIKIDYMKNVQWVYSDPIDNYSYINTISTTPSDEPLLPNSIKLTPSTQRSTKII